MRICLSLHHFLDAGAGAPGAVLSLAEGLRQLGVDATAVGFNILPKALQGRLANLAYPFWLAGWLWRRRYQFDVVDGSTGDLWVFGLLPRRRGQLLVTHTHGLEHVGHVRLMNDVKAGRACVSWKYPFYRGSYRLFEVAQSLRCADLCLFLNNHEMEFAVARLGIPAELCHVVANGCSDVLLDEAPTLPKSGGGLRIVQLGSYIARKGIKTGAAVLERFLRDHPDSRMTFLGASCPAPRVLADYPDDLQDRIDVIERFDRGELMKLVADKQVLLFPSLFEGAPLALVEGMACGLVPVVSDIPGVREVVTEGVDALTFPAGDVDACLVQLGRLADDRALLDRLGRGARHRAEAYRWTTIAQGRVELYRTYLARRVNGRR
jgi:glycosyltransferase involved in cell wall biosynthesis